MQLPRLLRLLVLVLAASTFAFAQDAADPARAATRAAHSAYETVLRDPPLAPRDGPDAAYHDAVRAWQARLAAAERAFVASFRESTWEDWSGETDTDLLERGLLMVGNAAFADGDGDTAVRALELLIAKLPRVRTRMAFPVHELPLAYVVADRIEDGRRRTAEFLEIAPQMYVPRLLVVLGDYECLLGDLDAARGFYRRADAAVSAELRNCCGAEAAAARDAVIKLAALDAVRDVPAAEWTVGDPLVPGFRACVVAFGDIYRSWDATVAVALGAEMRDAALPGIVGVVVTPAEAAATPDADGRPARDPRYVGRAEPSYPAPERAAELRRNLGLALPVIGVAATAIPCDLWVGDYDVVLAAGRGAVFVRGPADGRVVLHALLRRLARER